MKIRQMIPEDISQVAAIEKECFSVPWSEKVYAETLANENAFYVVAELTGEESSSDLHGVSAGKIVGMCGMMNILGEGDVSNVAVTASFRGRKIAERMLEELIHKGREWGMQTLILEVRSSNAPAIHIYEKYGFRQIGLRKAFYEHPQEDACIMSCQLSR